MNEAAHPFAATRDFRVGLTPTHKLKVKHLAKADLPGPLERLAALVRVRVFFDNFYDLGERLGANLSNLSKSSRAIKSDQKRLDNLLFKLVGWLDVASFSSPPLWGTPSLASPFFAIQSTR